METNRLDDLILSMSLTFNSSPEKSEVFDAFDIVGDRTLKWRGLQNNQYASSRRRNSRIVNSGNVDYDTNVTLKTEGSESVSEDNLVNGFVGDETESSLSTPNKRSHNEEQDSATNSKLYFPSSPLELSQSQEVPCKRRLRGRPAKLKNMPGNSFETVGDKVDESNIEIAGKRWDVSEGIHANTKHRMKAFTSSKHFKVDKCEEDSDDLCANDSKTKYTAVETQPETPEEGHVEQKFKMNSDGIFTESSSKSKFLRRSKRHNSGINSHLPDERSENEPALQTERGFDKTEYNNGNSHSILLCDSNDTKIDLAQEKDSLDGRIGSLLESKGKYDNTIPVSRRSSRLKRCTSKLLLPAQEGPLDNPFVQPKQIRATRANRYFTKHKLGRPAKDSQLSNKNVNISNKNASEIAASTGKLNKHERIVPAKTAKNTSIKLLRRGRRRNTTNFIKDKNMLENITTARSAKIKSKIATNLNVEQHIKIAKMPLNGKIPSQVLLKPQVKISKMKAKKKKLVLTDNHRKKGSKAYIRFSMRNEQNFDLSTVRDKCSYLRLLGLKKACKAQKESMSNTKEDMTAVANISGVNNSHLSSDTTCQSGIVKNVETKSSQERRNYLTCLCEGEPIQMLVHRKQVSFCHALDNINGTIVGCLNKIEDNVYPKLFRPSHRVQYMTLCIDHASRMRDHNCCALCGIFCTQGNFIICKSQHVFHASCAKLFSQVHNIDETPNCHLCPHCGNSETYKIYIMSMKCRKLPIFSIASNSSLL